MDMTRYAGTEQNLIPNNAQNAVNAYGQEPSKGYKGVNYDSGIGTNWPRMNSGPEAPGPGAMTNYTPLPTNATHGAIGGAPGYADYPPANYQYHYDRDRSIEVDMEMRRRARAVGVPVKMTTPADYGFPGSILGLPPIVTPPPRLTPFDM